MSRLFHGKDVGRPSAPRDAMDRGARWERWLARGLVVACVVLSVVWGRWWLRSYRHDRLLRGQATWVPVLPFLAGDFKVHIDHTARRLAAGHDPYDKAHDWVCAIFPYPPMIPRVYAWVSWMSIEAAIGVWLACSALLFAGAAWWVSRIRLGLGLTHVPAALILVGVLYSTPVLFAMERGQSDSLVLPLVGGAVWLLSRGPEGRRGLWGGVVAGALLAVAAWLKYYPGLFLVSLVVFRRWTALAAGVLVALAIGAVDHVGVARSLENGLFLKELGEKTDQVCHAAQHSIAKSWPHVCRVLRLKPLAGLPWVAGSAILLAPIVGIVSWKIARAPADTRRRLMAPYALWVIAAATFAMPYSNDYNLFFLPLAALAVWDARDRVIVHMMMGLFLLWWQPLRLPVDGTVIFLAKLGGLWAVGFCLERLAREGTEVAAGETYARVGMPHVLMSGASGDVRMRGARVEDLIEGENR